MDCEEWSSQHTKLIEAQRSINHAENLLDALPNTRYVALTRTKLEEAAMWLEKCFDEHWRMLDGDS